MTYAAASAMRRSASLKGRIESSAYAHDQGIQWVDRNLPALCATPEWVTAWTSARADAIEVGDMDRDLGTLNNVITDDMIDAAVAALVEQAPDSPEQTLAKQLADLQTVVAQQAVVIEQLQAERATEAPA